MTKLKEIVLISKGAYTANTVKTVFTHVMGKDGRIDKVPNVLFDKDPRGDWKFVLNKPFNGHAGDETIGVFTLKETYDWINRTPSGSNVDEEIKRRNPGICEKWGPDVEYVTLEEALVSFFKVMRKYVVGGEFAVVCTPETVDVCRTLVEAGWPRTRIENANLLDAPKKAAPVKKAVAALVEEIAEELEAKPKKKVTKKVEATTT